MLKDLLTKHRGLVIFLFAVPVSFLFQLAQDIRNWYFRTFLATNKLHKQKIQKICELVQQTDKEGKMLCTARAAWKTMSLRKATYKDGCIQIPIDLKNILELDHEKNTVRVEPMVTMGDMTHYLISKGYALAVQVEMDDLTVGGLCMGIGIETSSHKYGFLYETIKAYELIAADGTLLRATATENPDLFHALPMSHGTLGFLVAVELEVIPVKKYMKLNYLPCHSMEDFNTQLASLAEAKPAPSFIEGLAFSASTGVVMTGEMTDKIGPDGKLNRINRWYKPWFYSHVQTFLETGSVTEYIPLRHYFHRHTPSVFFQMKMLIPFANRWWYRWLFAWLGAPKISLMKYSMTKELRKKAFANRVTQDLVIPIKDLNEAITKADQYFGIYPLWICPVRIFNHDLFEGLIRNPQTNDKSELFVDVGIYGISPRVKNTDWNSVKTGRKLEAFTQQKGGFHMLYADIFMKKKEFESMFSHDLYRAARTKYGADSAFPEVYTKVIPEDWLINLEEVAEEEQPEEELVEI